MNLGNLMVTTTTTTTDNQRYGILKAALVNRRYSRMAKKGLMGVQLVHKRSDQGA